VNNLIPVEGEPRLFRDPSTGAIVSNSASKKDPRNKRFEVIEERLEKLEGNIDEILKILRNGLNK
jgi:tetrahydromethanopterin S-methyltransferase subunit B